MSHIPEGPFPAAIVNITNRCTLRCRHCFVYREGTPHEAGDEMDDATMLKKLDRLRKRHGIFHMLWMGGEPLLRPEVLRRGVKLFPRNTITTNGTIDLIEFPDCIYVVSLDGPPDINDAVRGKGVFKRVMKTIERVPEAFASKVMCQCVVTPFNEDRLGELVELLIPTRFEGMTFSFYVPRQKDDSGLSWGSLEKRDKAVREVMRLKEKYPEYIWNKKKSLDLMRSENALAVTRNCPSKRFVLPLYLEGGDFVSPFCCYGNDVDCDLCGGWVVFHIAVKIEEALSGGGAGALT